MVDLVDRAAILEDIGSGINHIYSISKKSHLSFGTVFNVLKDFEKAGLIVKTNEKREYWGRKSYKLTTLGEETVKLNKYLEKIERKWVPKEGLPFSPVCFESAKRAGLIEEEERRKLTVFEFVIRKKNVRKSLVVQDG